VLQCIAVCCSVLQCVAVCCSVLQGVAGPCDEEIIVCMSIQKRTSIYIYSCRYTFMYIHRSTPNIKKMHLQTHTFIGVYRRMPVHKFISIPSYVCIYVNVCMCKYNCVFGGCLGTYIHVRI